jgi:hypothetical protein
MPTTGLTLPFMSYGRSSQVISLLGTGILINIGRLRASPRAVLRRERRTEAQADRRYGGTAVRRYEGTERRKGDEASRRRSGGRG